MSSRLENIRPSVLWRNSNEAPRGGETGSAINGVPLKHFHIPYEFQISDVFSRSPGQISKIYVIYCYS